MLSCGSEVVEPKFRPRCLSPLTIALELIPAKSPVEWRQDYREGVEGMWYLFIHPYVLSALGWNVSHLHHAPQKRLSLNCVKSCCLTITMLVQEKAKSPCLNSWWNHCGRHWMIQWITVPYRLCPVEISLGSLQGKILLPPEKLLRICLSDSIVSKNHIVCICRRVAQSFKHNFML